MLFSHRKGLRPVKSVMQVDSMDDGLRNGLWNCFTAYYESNLAFGRDGYHLEEQLRLSATIWELVFKIPLDTLPDSNDSRYKEIRDYFMGCSWNEVYDFLEVVVKEFYDGDRKITGELISSCNKVMERELSAYRIIGREVVQITKEEEITAIEETLKTTIPLMAVHTHLETALSFLADRKSPDYRNSIKESISAVEAASQLIAKKPQATLGDALKVIKDKIGLHPALEQAFQKMYGYTSDAQGIRHALSDEPNLKFIDAKFMLVSCSTFVTYLLAKAEEAKIKL